MIHHEDATTNTLGRGFVWLGMPLILLMVAIIGFLPMTWQQQAFFGVLMTLMAILVGRISNSHAATLVMVLLSMCGTARYAFWRVDSLRRYFFAPWSTVNALDASFMLLLLGAELYSFLILYLGYMQTIAPLRRTPVALPDSVEEWPHVDILIPTFNEPMEVVRYTILAAKQQDWPADKFKVWVLDDGDRQEFRIFAAEVGVGYIARPEHDHAKAGNINYALARSSGDLVAIFDCDHIPTRSFLQVTTGWFLRDPQLGMLQTPHHFYSPDPFERNLGNFRSIPSEGELFYGIIQDTNDLWNATFFCGSCAVLRRDCLDQVGGIAHETVTEDAHTSLRMQKLGWNTAYINLAQSAGLATETLGGHVKQRVRWARGMSQILRIDNPLFARGLSLVQRLCYLNAMLHFLYALPRLVFLTAPILYLVFGKLNIPGYWLAIMAFAMPHLFLANITNSRIQGHKRYSFWNEIYETVLSPYILLPTLFALVSPKFGKFNVTAKGQNMQEDSFDGKIARPFLVLLGLNLFALFMAVPRYLYWDRNHAGTVVMNLSWTLFNIVILGVSLSACWETRQRRKAVRVNTLLPVEIISGATTVAGVVRNLSVSGAAVAAPSAGWTAGDNVRVAFFIDDAKQVFEARVVDIKKGQTRFDFKIKSHEEHEAITRVLYLTADRWLDWNDGRLPDSIPRSLGAVFVASLLGFRKMLRVFHRNSSGPSAPMVVARNVVVLLLALSALLLTYKKAHGERLERRRVSMPTASQTTVQVPFSSLGTYGGTLFNSANQNQGIEIALPDDVLIEQGALHLKYSLPQANEAPSTLNVILNDTLLASITPTQTEVARGHGEITIPLPAEQLMRQNRITLQLANIDGSACSVEKSTKAPIVVEPDSEITLKEQRLVVANDLSLLPIPFTQRSANQTSETPMVFGHSPAKRTLQAAGIVASWFGSQALQGKQHFSVSIDRLPTGNAVLFLLAGEQVRGVAVSDSGQAELRIADNPADPFGKLLILSAASEDGLVHLAQAFAAGQLPLAGEHAGLLDTSEVTLPAPRQPDDAPRWIHTRRVDLQQLAGTDHVTTSGDNPINLYLRFAPDYDFGVNREMYLHLDYTNDAGPLDSRSNIVVRLNGVPATSVPLRGTGDVGPMQHANIPLGDLPASAFGNTLQTQFYFAPPAGQECQPNRFNAQIGKGTFLDLGAGSHLAKLPNLHLFSNAGFPFTRRADLEDTVVLLPHEVSPELISEYLNLLAYFGTMTGYPALRVGVDDISQATAHIDKDLLVMGTYRDLAAVPAIANGLPLQLVDGSWRLSTRARLVRWIGDLRHFNRTDASLEDAEIVPAGILESIESPFGSDHTVVVLMGQDNSAVAAMSDGLLTELPRDSIRDTVSLWQGGSFISYNLSTPRYRLGDASWFDRFALTLPDYPWALTLGMLLLCVVFARWMQIAIAMRIRRRLMGAPQLDNNLMRPSSRNILGSTH